MDDEEAAPHASPTSYYKLDADDGEEGSAVHHPMNAEDSDHSDDIATAIDSQLAALETESHFDHSDWDAEFDKKDFSTESLPIVNRTLHPSSSSSGRPTAAQAAATRPQQATPSTAPTFLVNAATDVASPGDPPVVPLGFPERPGPPLGLRRMEVSMTPTTAAKKTGKGTGAGPPLRELLSTPSSSLRVEHVAPLPVFGIHPRPESQVAATHSHHELAVPQPRARVTVSSHPLTPLTNIA